MMHVVVIEEDKEKDTCMRRGEELSKDELDEVLKGFNGAKRIRGCNLDLVCAIVEAEDTREAIKQALQQALSRNEEGSSNSKGYEGPPKGKVAPPPC
ncbi:hypothetical protein HAX54_041710 [Datura stramonium]|uniref:Uncharacterized protein n=1 Tax=Datura stramonium TaxID=4076 RepID=A0ABS8VZV9_DATST|nr:hypothetical protein [Datura stramonium]